MAIVPVPPRSSHRRQDTYDPILRNLANTNTFSSDWPTLRHHLQLALLAAVPIFLALGPPRPPSLAQSPAAPPHGASNSSPRTPSPPAVGTRTVSSISDEGEKPPSQSLLLSPSQPATPPENPTMPSASTPRPAVPLRSGDAESPTSPSENRMTDLGDTSGLQPSTQGGLIIPPFPPLDSSRRRRGSAPTPSPNDSPRVNGHPSSAAMAGVRSQNMLEDEWDEDVLIGGRKLPGWHEEEEGKKEVEKLAKLLEEMDQPPFTIQRLAELLLHPAAQHNSLGKLLRAVEKSLLVTTPYEIPSYTYVPTSAIPGTGSLFGDGSSPSSNRNNGDSDSTMPPGARTPMFSPIPFLSGPGPENGSDIHMAAVGIENGRSTDDGLMSPLMLGGGDSPNMSGAFQFAPAPNVRSPTPEPEELEHLSGSDTDNSDPGHRPYLGRVDELDTGPLSASSSPSNGHDAANGRDDPHTSGDGSGEGGNMTPHGMSERPVPISSTTTMGDGERRIAGLPRSTSRNSDLGSLGQRFVSADDVETSEGRGEMEK